MVLIPGRQIQDRQTQVPQTLGLVVQVHKRPQEEGAAPGGSPLPHLLVELAQLPVLVLGQVRAVRALKLHQVTAAMHRDMLELLQETAATRRATVTIKAVLIQAMATDSVAVRSLINKDLLDEFSKSFKVIMRLMYV